MAAGVTPSTLPLSGQTAALTQIQRSKMIYNYGFNRYDRQANVSGRLGYFPHYQLFSEGLEINVYNRAN
jgi:hypothetical protein